MSRVAAWSAYLCIHSNARWVPRAIGHRRPKTGSLHRGLCGPSKPETNNTRTLTPRIEPMRPFPILLALVVVLGFVSEAGAQPIFSRVHNYSVTIAGQHFGF